MAADDIERDLDAFLEEPIPTETLPAEGAMTERVVVVAAPDEEVASKVLFKLGKLTEEVEHVAEVRDRRIREMQDWASDRVSGTLREMRRAQESLELFTRRWREENPKAKSKTLALWSGKLALARSKGKMVMTAEQTFIAWAVHHRPDLLRYDPKPAKAKLADGYLVARHPGPQDELGGDELLNTWRLMVPVIQANAPAPGCPQCGTVNDDPIIRWPEKVQVSEEDEPTVTPIQYRCRDCGWEWPAPTEVVTIPGVAYGEAVRDKFTATPTPPKKDPTTGGNQ